MEWTTIHTLHLKLTFADTYVQRQSLTLRDLEQKAIHTLHLELTFVGQVQIQYFNSQRCGQQIHKPFISTSKTYLCQVTTEIMLTLIDVESEVIHVLLQYYLCRVTKETKLTFDWVCTISVTRVCLDSTNRWLYDFFDESL